MPRPTTSLFTALLLLLLLLLFALSSAARHGPIFVSYSAVKSQSQGVEAEKQTEVVGVSCEGEADEDKCLMRRTMAAHIDYIYTQKEKP